MPHTSDIPHFGSAQALARFFLRLLILTIFSALSSQGFGKTLESLLVMAVFYCVFIAAIRREEPFGPLLTHFDEAAAYAVIRPRSFPPAKCPPGQWRQVTELDHPCGGRGETGGAREFRVRCCLASRIAGRGRRCDEL